MLTPGSRIEPMFYHYQTTEGGEKMSVAPEVPDWAQSDVRGLILMVESFEEKAARRGDEEYRKNFAEIVSHLQGFLKETK